MPATRSLQREQVLAIASKLSAEPELRLPARLTQSKASDAEKTEYLSALLQHDPGVFLERHGNQLSAEQRSYFEPLREDYEVDFYLKLLEDKDASSSKPSQESTISSTAKNRRLAKLNRLEEDGFFDEEAVRKRAPLLHFQYLGKYSKSSGPPVSGAAPSLHERIIQQHEEAELQQQMARQQRKEELAEEAFNATLSESSEEEDEEVELQGEGEAADGKAREAAAPILAEELEQNRQDLHTIMQARFLSGEDGGAEADADASLDDDWSKERTQDAEDRYFDA